MALQYVGGAYTIGDNVNFDVSLTALTGGIDTQAREGDFVVAVDAFTQLGNVNPGVSTSGYTEIIDTAGNDSNDAQLSVNWKFMGATPDTTVTCLGSGSNSFGAVGLVHVWRGVDPTNPIDVASTTAIGADSSIPVHPSITPTTLGAEVLIIGTGTNSSTDNAITAPTGYGNLVNRSSDPGTAIIAAIASKAWSGSGAETPGAWSGWNAGGAADSWAAATIALRPAANLDVFNGKFLTFF